MKNISLLFYALLFCLGIPCVSFAEKSTRQSCEVPNNTQVEQLFNHWNEALQTSDPQKIVALYAQNAVLLPTLSNMPRTNHQELMNYFTYFVKNRPSGKIDSRVIRSGCNWATDTGLYTFTFIDATTKKEHSVKARFSYAYENIDGVWLIVSHHSSLLPNDVDFKEDQEEMSQLESDH